MAAATAAIPSFVPDETRHVLEQSAASSSASSEQSYCRVGSTTSSKVWNEECVYTFHSPLSSPEGIVVNLHSWVGTIPALAFAATANPPADGLFVRFVQQKVLKPEYQQTDEDKANQAKEEKLPTTFGIGVEGGFVSESDKYETKSTYSFVHLKQRKEDGTVQVVAEYPYSLTSEEEIPNSDKNSREWLPKRVCEAMDFVITQAGSTLQQQVEAWQLDQGQEALPVTKYANTIPHVDNDVALPMDPRFWTCQQHPNHVNATATDNVWFNLSDGFVGGGRLQWDGSGGTNGALDHFNETGGKYPLVVKLGTLAVVNNTSNSDDWQLTADCYSYAPDEDGPVHITNLRHLLERRGPATAAVLRQLQKTVHSTAEKEVQLNATYNFFAETNITEDNKRLVPRQGPSLQGLQNLGNSCYLNSVAQVLFHLPQLQQRYVGTTTTTSYNPFAATLPPSQAPDHVLVQTAKLATALVAGMYHDKEDEKKKTAEEEPSTTSKPLPMIQPFEFRLAPRMFKHTIAQRHVDFCTGQQQDAAQYLQYFWEQLDRAEQVYYSASSLANNVGGDADGKQEATEDKKQDEEVLFYPSSHWFSFGTETKSICTADQKVKYQQGQGGGGGGRETLWTLRIPMELATTPAVEEQSSNNANNTGIEGDDANQEPDQKRHKGTETEGSSPPAVEGADTAMEPPVESSPSPTVTPMETTPTTESAAAAAAGAMDTGSNSTAATAASATTVTTATMALTDDEEEHPTQTSSAAATISQPESGAGNTTGASTTEPSSTSTNTSAPGTTTTTEKPPKLPQISLETCLDAWAAETVVDDVRWPHLDNARHAALQSTKLRNFPPYLMMQLQRYTLGDDWQPVKLQVELKVPEQKEKNVYKIDLAKYKAQGGPQPGEVLVPEEEDDGTSAPAPAAAKPSRPVLDEGALAQLMDMGFSLHSCQRALTAVGGSDVEAAMTWVFEHNTDPDFNDPLPPVDETPAAAAASSTTDGIDDATVQSLVEMLGCFTTDQVRFGLKQTNGAADRAADWLFSHMEELDALMIAAANDTEAAATATVAKTKLPPLEDSTTCSTYQLVGLISHIGKHTGSGHYVAHVLVQTPDQPKPQWIIFNDEKVAESEHPPVEHAYLYLWQRTDTLPSASGSAKDADADQMDAKA